jgi:hypothetical protein
MGMTVALENEDGTKIARIEDPPNVLHRVLPRSENPAFQWADTIDWYGDTSFNYLQAGRLRIEIDELLQRCSSGRLLYVKFYGA